MYMNVDLSMASLCIAQIVRSIIVCIFQWGNNVHWFNVDFIRFHSTQGFAAILGRVGSMVSFQNFGKATTLQFWNFIPLWLLWSCGDSLLRTTPSYSWLTTKLWWRWLINSRRGIIILCVCLDDLSSRPWSLTFILRQNTSRVRIMSLLTACLAFRSSQHATRRPGFTRVQTQSHRNFYLGASDVASAQCSSDRGHMACL